MTARAFTRPSLALSLLLWSGALGAQPAVAPEGQPKAPIPETYDTMLEVVPPPGKTLSGWRQALELASAEDTNYSASLFEVERARGQERQTLAGTLPTLTATGNVTFHLLREDVTSFDTSTGTLVDRTIPSSPTASASLVLRQPILAPRVWWAIGTAERTTELAKTGVEDRRRILVAAVADAIVTVVTAERAAEQSRVGLKAALERLVLQKRRLDLGAGTLLDIVRFDQDVVSARAVIIQSNESLRQARERLGLALGSTEPWGVRPDISLDGIQDEVTRGCTHGKVDDRADLRVLRLRQEIAERAVTDADLLYAPTAEVTSNTTFSSEKLIGESHVSWSVAGLLTVPIWDGGARYGIRRSAEATARAEQERIDGATRTASLEVSQSERAVTVAALALAVARQGRDLAAETDRLARLAFENGDATSFDLVDAARRLREAELSLTVRELELVRSKIASMLSTANCAY